MNVQESSVISKQDGCDNLYLYSRYVKKGRLTEEQEQILYKSLRHLYFYSKHLHELGIKIPDHIFNFFLASSCSNKTEDENNYFKKFFDLVKSN